MFTFTTLGNSGSYGPKTSQTYANMSNVSVTNGIQNWNVPTTGTYMITAAGATSSNAGRAVTGNVFLKQGDILSIIVGQIPTPLVANTPDNITLGGGGGTFIALNGNILIVASGGDGGGSTTGNFSPYGNGLGSSGAGYFTNGAVSNPIFPYVYPRSYLNGGNGGIYQYGQITETGGFGGGQTPIGLVTPIQSIIGNGTLVKVITNGVHGYPNNYQVVISGTINFNGTFIIQVSNTTAFTFSSSINNSESTGFVNGQVSGAAGGGGYSGSNGTGSGATCFANSNVINFTDLGAQSNTSGYVTCSLNGQASRVYNLNITSIWTLVANYTPSCYAVTWSQKLQKFITISNSNKPIIGLTSDGINWEYPIVNLPPDIYVSIECSPSGNIVTSNGYTSTDGIIWSQSSSHTQYINYMNNQFISTTSSTTLYTSIDGFNWNTITTTGVVVLFVQAYDGSSTYVGIDDSLRLIYSTNLINWTVSDSSAQWNSVTFGNGIFVACSYAHIATSTNGQTWTYRSFQTGYPWSAVKYVNGKFLIVSAPDSVNSTNFGSLLTSTDGIKWEFSFNNLTTVTSSSEGYYSSYFIGSSQSNSIFQLGGPAYITDSAFVVTSSKVLRTLPQQLVYSYELGAFVGVSQTSVFTSFDKGYTWIENNLTNSISYSTYISWSRELGIFIIYKSGIMLFTSNDGITWTGVQTIPSFSINCNPVWSKELGIFSCGTATSKDGIHWVTGGNAALTSIAWCSQLRMFVGGGKSPVNNYYSFNGLNWFVSPTSISYFTSVCSNGTFFVGITQTSFPSMTYFYKSTDGKNWTQTYSIQLGIAPQNTQVMWVQELALFVAISAYTQTVNFGNTLFTSPDGSTWTNASSSNFNTNQPISTLAWSGTNFVAASYASTGVYVSPFTS